MVHRRKTHHNVICSDNSSLAAIAMQNNVLFIQRSIRKTIDLKTLLTLRTRAQSSSFLVSIFNLQMSRNTYTRDLYTQI